MFMCMEGLQQMGRVGYVEMGGYGLNGGGNKRWERRRVTREP